MTDLDRDDVKVSHRLPFLGSLELPAAQCGDGRKHGGNMEKEEELHL